MVSFHLARPRTNVRKGVSVAGLLKLLPTLYSVNDNDDDDGDNNSNSNS